MIYNNKGHGEMLFNDDKSESIKAVADETMMVQCIHKLLRISFVLMSIVNPPKDSQQQQAATRMPTAVEIDRCAFSRQSTSNSAQQYE